MLVITRDDGVLLCADGARKCNIFNYTNQGLHEKRSPSIRTWLAFNYFRLAGGKNSITFTGIDISIRQVRERDTNVRRLGHPANNSLKIKQTLELIKYYTKIPP